MYHAQIETCKKKSALSFAINIINLKCPHNTQIANNRSKKTH